MKKLFIKSIVLLVIVFMFCGCGKSSVAMTSSSEEEVSFHGGKYFYAFKPLTFSSLDTMKFVPGEGNGATGMVNNGKDEFGYTVKGDKVSFRIPFYGEDTEYMYYKDKYLVDTKSLLKGNIPDTNYFEVKCKATKGNSEYKITFFKDGSCKLKTEDAAVREGSYSRSGNEISVTFSDDGLTYVYLIYERRLTYSYLKLWSEDTNLAKRKRMEIMTYINSVMEPLNFDSSLTKDDIEARKAEVWQEVAEEYNITENEIHNIMNDAELMLEYYNRH